MIYFLRSPKGGPIKIGTSTGLRNRLTKHRAAYDATLRVIAVMDGHRPEEKAIHVRFSHLKVGDAPRDEWFDAQPDLLKFIADHGRRWDGRDERRGVLMDDDLCAKARLLAAWRGTTVADLFIEVLRPWVDREWAKEVRKLKENGGSE